MALPNLLPDPVVGTRISYRLIFPDTRDPRPGPGNFISKELGSVVLAGDGQGVLPNNDEEATVVAGGPMAGELGGEPEKSLQEARLVIGDYVSCAIYPALSNGSVVPALTGGATSRSGGPPRGRDEPPREGRENGYNDFRIRGGGRSHGRESGLASGTVPSGEWRRGERIPDGPGGSTYGRGRGRGRY